MQSVTVPMGWFGDVSCLPRLALCKGCLTTPRDAADAELTKKGRAQARAANAIWKIEHDAGLPEPDHFYVSPLSRALETCKITFKGIFSLSPANATILEVSI